MKWISHKAITGAIIWGLTTNPILTVASVIGSTFPDWIETPPWAYSDKYKYLSQHRRGSHWFIPYAAAAILAAILVVGTGTYYHIILHHITNINSIFHYLHSNTIKYFIINNTVLLGLFFLIGCLFHILEDGITGKVPGLHIRKKIGVRLFKVGSIQEYIVVAAILLIVYFCMKV